MIQKNVSTKAALNQLKLVASRAKLSVQYKEAANGEMPIRVLNSSKKVVASGTLKMRGKFVDGSDLKKTRNEIASLNSSRDIDEPDANWETMPEGGLPDEDIEWPVQRSPFDDDLPEEEFSDEGTDWETSLNSDEDAEAADRLGDAVDGDWDDAWFDNGEEFDENFMND